MAERKQRAHAQGSSDNDPTEPREAARPGDSALYHHRNAAFHHETAAHHHRQAAKQRDAGNHHESDLHAHAANTHGEEAASHGRHARVASGSEKGRNRGIEDDRVGTSGAQVERGFDDENDRDDEGDSPRRERNDAARVGAAYDGRGENGTARGASRHSS